MSRNYWKGKKNKKWRAEVKSTIIYTAPTILLQMLFYNFLWFILRPSTFN